jgi:hypothetical protein
MLKEDEVVGVIMIYRQEIQPFTDKQIALVQNPDPKTPAGRMIASKTVVHVVDLAADGGIRTLVTVPCDTSPSARNSPTDGVGVGKLHRLGDDGVKDGF